MTKETNPLAVERSNTILYCEAWSATVDFYRHVLALPVTFENEWLVEFKIHSGAMVSVADAGRATIVAGHGDGITLSWRVADAGAARLELVARGVVTSPVTRRWGSSTTMFNDPAGNRIELWSDPK